MKLTDTDLFTVRAFRNFLSWNSKPARPGVTPSRAVPPAWWAYVQGHTEWCPPKGEL